MQSMELKIKLRADENPVNANLMSDSMSESAGGLATSNKDYLKMGSRRFQKPLRLVSHDLSSRDSAFPRNEDCESKEPEQLFIHQMSDSMESRLRDSQVSFAKNRAGKSS